MNIGSKFTVLGMTFRVYKETKSVNGIKCYLAAAQGIKNVYHQLIIQGNGFIYGTSIKVKPIGTEANNEAYL